MVRPERRRLLCAFERARVRRPPRVAICVRRLHRRLVRPSRSRARKPDHEVGPPGGAFPLHVEIRPADISPHNGRSPRRRRSGEQCLHDHCLHDSCWLSSASAPCRIIDIHDDTGRARDSQRSLVDQPWCTLHSHHRQSRDHIAVQDSRAKATRPSADPRRHCTTTDTKSSLAFGCDGA